MQRGGWTGTDLLSARPIGEPGAAAQWHCKLQSPSAMFDHRSAPPCPQERPVPDGFPTARHSPAPAPAGSCPTPPLGSLEMQQDAGEVRGSSVCRGANQQTVWNVEEIESQRPKTDPRPSETLQAWCLKGIQPVFFTCSLLLFLSLLIAQLQ